MEFQMTRARVPISATFLVLCCAALLCGCASSSKDSSTSSNASSRPSEPPAELATPAYWLARPAVDGAVSPDFYRLWNACERTARDHFFGIDRTDYRDGLLTTLPMVSAQAFEPWRQDVGTFGDLWLSSLQTIRRTIRFDFSQIQGGLYVARPRVLIEKLAQAQQRVTSFSEYRSILTPGQPVLVDGNFIPIRYWYTTGRDEAFEHRIAKEIRDKLRD
jgi:hypothetical protein